MLSGWPSVAILERTGVFWVVNAATAPVKLSIKFQYTFIPPASSNTDYAAARFGDNKGLMPTISIDPLIRVAGRDAPLTDVVERIDKRVLTVTLNRSMSEEDYALIDPVLAMESSLATPIDAAPAPGLGYAAFTPRQRGWFLAWLKTPLAPAPPAFQQLYLANLEVRLLEGNRAAWQQLEELMQSDAWTINPGLWRVALLAAWLAQDGALLANWLAAVAMPSELTGLALGLQALLGAPLTATEVQPIARAWSQPAANLSEAVLAFRLQSLHVTLGAEPLAYALDQLGDDARTPQPWRCQHRDLRLRLPQPDLRRTFEPLLAELASVRSSEDAPVEIDDSPELAQDKAHEELSRAHIVLEFRQSRSEYFPFALRLAQKRAGFVQLLDEDRHLVYRVIFRKNEMNAFWQLWNYVQSWSATRVFYKGQELQKRQVYPYSQYLR